MLQELAIKRMRESLGSVKVSRFPPSRVLAAFNTLVHSMHPLPQRGLGTGHSTPKLLHHITLLSEHLSWGFCS